MALPNGTCETAEVVLIPSTTTTPILDGADDPGAPCPDCAYSCDERHFVAWYQFTPVSNVTLLIQTCDSPVQDTLLSVWSGGCGTLVQEACSEDVCGDSEFSSRVVLNAIGGVTYWIQISDYYDDDTGSYVLDISEVVAAPNNLWADAIVISQVPYTLTEPINGSGTDPDTPEQSCYFATDHQFNTVWWKWTAPAEADGLTVRISTAGSTILESNISAWTGEPGAFVEVACGGYNVYNVNSSAELSQAYFVATAGVTYSFLVSTYDESAPGNLTFGVEVLQAAECDSARWFINPIYPEFFTPAPVLTPFVPSGYQGAWDFTPFSIPFPTTWIWSLSAGKSGYTSDTAGATRVPPDPAGFTLAAFRATAVDTLLAQTIAGVFNLVWPINDGTFVGPSPPQTLELGARVYMYVTVGDTNAVRGVLCDYVGTQVLPHKRGSGGNFVAFTLNLPITMTPVVAHEGDRIVIEGGVVIITEETSTNSNTDQFPMSGGLFYGEELPDMEAGAVIVSAQLPSAPYVEFIPPTVYRCYTSIQVPTCENPTVIRQPTDLHVEVGTLVTIGITVTPQAPLPPEPGQTRTDIWIYDPNAGGGSMHGTAYRGQTGDRSNPISETVLIEYTVVFQTPPIQFTDDYWVDLVYQCPGQDPYSIPTSNPRFFVDPPPHPQVTSLTVNCVTGNLVVTGTGFASNASVALTRDGIAQGFTFVSKTSTQLVLHPPSFVAGRFCAIVTNPGVGSSDPLCADLACQQAAVSRLAVDCPSSMIIVTGTGFESNATIGVTRNAITRSFTLAGITATEIRLFLPGDFVDGQYCVTVVNPGTVSLGPFCAQLSCPTGPPPPPTPPTPGGGPGTECDPTLPQPTCVPVTD